MIRITLLLLLLVALGLPAFAAVSCCAVGDDNVVVMVSCAHMNHRISSVVNASASGTADALLWSVRTVTDCAGNCAKQAGCVVCGVRKAAGAVITSTEDRLQEISTEVISQSLQLLRNALSFLWALVLGLLRF
jgi:hypothetical protein